MHGNYHQSSVCVAHAFSFSCSCAQLSCDCSLLSAVRIFNIVYIYTFFGKSEPTHDPRQRAPLDQAPPVTSLSGSGKEGLRIDCTQSELTYLNLYKLHEQM